jgi:4-amino-4-deoxy-L-arabinose transferase-like glycosyltransferase
VLLLGTPLFHAMNRIFMTDVLLTLFVVAAMFLVSTDPRWERRATGIAFGVFSGAAIMTKSAAGFLPLLIIAVYWAIAGSKERPPWRRILVAFAVAAIVAAPWHIYQFVVHQDWFMAEYVRFQLLGSGVTAPSRYNEDSNFWFYLKTLLRTDPILLALWLTSIPWILMAWSKSNGAQARLLAAWFLISALALGVFGTRAAYYLLPPLPVLVLMTVEFSPLLRGRLAWIVCAAMIAIFGVRAEYKSSAVPPALALDSYSRLRRRNELVIVSTDDEFYASVLDLPKVRYVYLTPLDPTKTSEFFYRLGMIVSGEEFCSLPRLMPVYEQRLRAWKLPDRLHPEATLIDAGAPSELPRLIQCSPDRDFLIPESLRAVAGNAASATHIAWQSSGFFLLSKNSSRRSVDSIAPGTLVGDRPR